MICPNCGTNLDDGAKECLFCGYALGDAVGTFTETSSDGSAPCSKCGNPVPAGKTFCPMCGNKIGAESATENKVSEPAVQEVKPAENITTDVKPDKPGSKKKAGIIGGLVAAGAAAGIIIPLVIFNVGKPNLTLEEQLESLQAKAETASAEEYEELVKEAEEIKKKLDESVAASESASLESELASIEAESKKESESQTTESTTAQTETQSQETAAAVQREPLTVTAQPAVIISKAGNILNTGQVDSYTFDAPNDGRYRAEVTGLQSGGSVDMEFFDGAGNLLESQYGCRNGDGVTVKDLIGGARYEVKLSETSGNTPYMLSVGLQKATLDISSATEAKDSVEYTDQRNLYSFTPAVTGDYRFELDDVAGGVLLDMFVFDDPGNKLDSREAAGSGQGLTIKNMKGGEEYEIQVRQSKGLGEYSLLVK